jgi:hypothetical protein
MKTETTPSRLSRAAPPELLPRQRVGRMLTSLAAAAAVLTVAPLLLASVLWVPPAFGGGDFRPVHLLLGLVCL